MSEELAIKVEHISKSYNLYNNQKDRFFEAIGLKRKAHNSFMALNDINFNVKKGETVGIVGTNGSGKSTLLKIITGVLSQSFGEVFVDGKISALLELGAGFNQEYTGIENIFLYGRMMGLSKQEMNSRLNAIIEFAEIGDFINQPVKTYSSGMFARLAFAVSININPDILIVDEALSVGDLFFQNKCFKKFEELKNKGVTILFVSHDISSVRQMCSRTLWIEKGKQIIFDSSDKVCDMYMDYKRIDMNSLYEEKAHEDAKYLNENYSNDIKNYPVLTYKESAILSDKLEIKSFFITDENNKITNSLEIDKKYEFHVVVLLHENLDELIVGVVVENNKGIPLYDLNNYINNQKVIKGKNGDVIETTFKFKLPRIMRGSYILSSAVAKGTQIEHKMLTWLHGVGEIEVINNGYNSSYIEIPADIKCNVYNVDKVNYYE